MGLKSGPVPGAFDSEASNAPPNDQWTRLNVAIDVEGPQTAAVGQTVRYEIKITNRGASVLRDLVLSDRFDSGLKHGSDISPISRPRIELQPAETKSFSLDFLVTKPGTLSHTVEVANADDVRAIRRMELVASERNSTKEKEPKESRNRPAIESREPDLSGRKPAPDHVLRPPTLFAPRLPRDERPGETPSRPLRYDEPVPPYK
jgi:uncharacterized repeat protein (TIGR01451 family)